MSNFGTPITAYAQRVLRPDHIRILLRAFGAWKALPAERRLEAIQRIRDEASLDETAAGADIEVIANFAEALHVACERGTR